MAGGGGLPNVHIYVLGSYLVKWSTKGLGEGVYQVFILLRKSVVLKLFAESAILISMKIQSKISGKFAKTCI